MLPTSEGGCQTTTSAASRPARFRAESVPITAQVVAEFFDTGIPTVVSMAAVRGLAFEAADEEQPPAAEPASAAQVQKMLDAADGWEIALTLTQPAGTFVVTKQLLLDGLAGQADPADVVARRASASERLLHESAPKLLGPEAALDRVKGAIALPVSQAGLVATTAGLFGLSALEDSIARPGLVSLAVLCALLAVALSLWGTHALETVEFVPARLDLVRKQYESMVSKPLKASNRGVVLLLAASVLALFAVWPASSSPEKQDGTISTAIQRVAGGYGAVIEASWTNLEEDVMTVETTVTQGGEGLGVARASKKADATVAHKLEVALRGAADVDIETRALDATGSVVGDPIADSLAVPAG